MADQELQQEQAQEPVAQAPSLTLQDLILVAQIIQLAFLQSTGALTPAQTEETKND